jgi:methionyl-tRNA formyltransferase
MEAAMLRIAFLGTPDFTLPLLETCARAGELVCVVAQPDRPVGRSGAPQAPPSKQWAIAHSIPVLQPLKVKNGALAAALAEFKPDVAIVAAYGRILPADALAAPRLGCLNVHASLLPLLRGAAPAQWAIARQLAVTGVTLMQMDEGLDTGDILLQREIPIAPEETGESILTKLGALGADLLAEGLAKLEAGGLSRTPQDHARATLAPILTREDGQIDWTRSAREIDARRRGFTPWPGAFTLLEGKQLKVHASVVIESPRDPATSTGAAPGAGEIVRATKDGIDVACGNGSLLRITELQPEGKKRMATAAFLAGRPLKPGVRLG